MANRCMVVANDVILVMVIWLSAHTSFYDWRLSYDLCDHDRGCDKFAIPTECVHQTVDYVHLKDDYSCGHGPSQEFFKLRIMADDKKLRTLSFA